MASFAQKGTAGVDEFRSLAVVTQEVVHGQAESTDWGFRFYTGVGPMPVVSMEPGWEFFGSTV
jgi:hypothetical protein